LKSVEFLLTALLLIVLSISLFQTYSLFEIRAKQALETFTSDSEIRYTSTLINSLVIFGAPFEFEGSLTSRIDRVKNEIGSEVEFNPYTGRYEYLTCRRW